MAVRIPIPVPISFEIKGRCSGIVASALPLANTDACRVGKRVSVSS